MPTDEKQETEALYGSHAFQDLCQANPTEHQVKERVTDRISNSWGIPCRNVSASRTVGKKWKLGAESLGGGPTPVKRYVGQVTELRDANAKLHEAAAEAKAASAEKQRDLGVKLREHLTEAQDLRRTAAAQLLRINRLDPVAQYAVLLKKRIALVKSRRAYVLHTLKERLAAGQLYDERSAVGRWNKYVRDRLPGEEERMALLNFKKPVMTELKHHAVPGCEPCTLVRANEAANAWTPDSKATLRLFPQPAHWQDIILITDRFEADVQQAIASTGCNPEEAFEDPTY